VNEAGAAAPLRAIILYKSIKSALQLSMALALAVWWPLGLPRALLHLSAWLRHHITHGWAAHLAGLLAPLLAAESTSRRVLFAIGALALDGVLTGVEAWALHTGRTWGAWLVVATTGSLLPFEVYEFIRVRRWSRLVIFFVNLAILVYLARRTWRERRRVASR
jgi:uncharacterized membrane protein (DUF2068 family)